MKALVREKEKAIELRRQGYTYNEILKEVKVAKSSLSLWLKDLPLTTDEKNYLRKHVNKKISHGRIKAAAAIHNNKLKKDQEIIKIAQQEYQLFKIEPLFQTGVGLYWAEGAKRSSTFQFTNSDSSMINVMLVWLEKYAGYQKKDLWFRLYVHKAYSHENNEVKWAKELRIHRSQFKKTIYKPSDYSYKTRSGYKGCLRIEVPKSTELLLKMKAWIAALSLEYKSQK